MDKNTLTGFLLIGLVLVGFSYFNRPSEEQLSHRRAIDSIGIVEQQRKLIADRDSIIQDAVYAQQLLQSDSVLAQQRNDRFGELALASQGEEAQYTLENEHVSLTFSNLGAHLVEARLTQFQAYDSIPVVLMNDKLGSLGFSLITASNRVINTQDLYFETINDRPNNRLIFRLNGTRGGALDFIYTLRESDYRCDFQIVGHDLPAMLSTAMSTLDFEWNQRIRRQELGRQFEERHSGIYYKFLDEEVDNLSDSQDDDQSPAGRLKWIAFKDQFFSSVLIAEEQFESVELSSKVLKDEGYLKDLSAVASLPMRITQQDTISMQYYFGPNKYAQLKAYDEGLEGDDKLHLEKLVPLGGHVFGFVNRWLTLPVFNFFGRFIDNYGLIILLLTIVVKIILFPLTYKSYMSSAKMRVLRPQVEEINKRYPNKEQAMEKQQAVMSLYSKAGASPMSGCLPMLLQMPILIALFMFFPSSIELRGESFLWVKDLSTYDAIVSWTQYIPIITPYFGNHISLFCVLMTVTNIIYTKFNMEQTNAGTEQMPGMKMMMYLMPLMFLVFFNQYAAGLSYYYFVSTLITIIQTLTFRALINDKKLLAQLEANKKKPAKKSGFMARLEEAQRKQQETLRQQQAAQRKSKR